MQGNDMLPAGGGGESGGNAKIVYIVYLGAVIIGLLAIIGVIVAYVSRDDSGGWVNDHYRFQIRTLWIDFLDRPAVFGGRRCHHLYRGRLAGAAGGAGVVDRPLRQGPAVRVPVRILSECNDLAVVRRRVGC